MNTKTIRAPLLIAMATIMGLCPETIVLITIKTKITTVTNFIENETIQITPAMGITVGKIGIIVIGKFDGYTFINHWKQTNISLLILQTQKQSRW